MNLEFYTVIHLVSIMALFTALGAVAASECPSCKKLGAILHGIALLLILVSGFGALAKIPGLGFPWWIIVKIVIWVVMGGMLTVAKRRILPCGAVIGLILALGAVAAFLGVYGRMLSAGS